MVVREALLLQRLLVAGIAATVVLLLELLDALVDLVVRDLDAHRVGLLRELGPLDEKGDRLAFELLVLRRAGLRERSLLRVVVLLGAIHERPELLLGDRLRAHDGSVVGAEPRSGRPTAARGDERKRSKQEENESLHGKSAICSGFLTLPDARPV